MMLTQTNEHEIGYLEYFSMTTVEVHLDPNNMLRGCAPSNHDRQYHLSFTI